MSEYVFKTDSPIRSCSECDYRCGLNIIARQNPEGRHEHCPLLELPPHGDLIDRSELPTTSITDYAFEGHTVVEYEDVKNATTILEASEEESK